MYVGPLKALINDQFRRIEDLCGYLDIPVFRWHGDVGASHKAKLVSEPGGVLLITPESLESLFVNRSEYLRKIFSGLRFVVIDELHSFLDNERGLHLRSLLHRVRRRMYETTEGMSFRTIALSATIGDFAAGQKFVDLNHPENVSILKDEDDEKEIKYRIHGYRVPVQNSEKNKSNQVLPHLREMAQDIVQHCKGHSNLVFANSRENVEIFADLAKQIAKKQHVADFFLVHHGALSTYIREDTEAVIKSDRPATAFCSSTLEMGIDIGSVRMIGQIGPSWSVASQLQRMGRSGRRDGEARIMRLYVDCFEPSSKSDLFDGLHLHLIQAIAISELMLEGWLEPAHTPSGDLSTLTLQVISVISETGGIRADALYQQLCFKGPFSDIEPWLFRDLLLQLGQVDVIEQMEGGTLILGLHGEKIRKDRRFYAAFQTEEEYVVLNEGKKLGTLQIIPQCDDHLVFAGQRWLVTEVDLDRHEIHVVPAKGWKPPKFVGGPGEIHPKVRQKMREVLASDRVYIYLDNEAKSLLNDARHVAQSTNLCNEVLVPLGPSATAMMTWTGTRIQDTLGAIFQLSGMPFNDKGIGLVFKISTDELSSRMKKFPDFSEKASKVARQVWPRWRRKYDYLLNDDLLDISLARGFLDIKGAQSFITELSSALS